ncbi:hypothetical protein [Novipirellula artificiosorum]|uniref:Uncharacterized protein n=1 Tax=Novipirellula artificiosorum TaxID=2528016 RepID=A0A5C6D3V5_9BACT|nr:hypothetical protein [Novipirellula artificiosorum]TWU30564.1 hypothetical protein Poly41_66590 [Novipirellula artificiosorum]
MTRATVRLLFGIAAVYDFAIGLVFLFAGKALFDAVSIPHPNHWGYVQFGSLMLIVFGLMFFQVARDPDGNRNLMPFGILLKASYVGIVSYYWLTVGCPFLFKPFVVIDLAMLILFAIAYSQSKHLVSSSESVATTA